MVNYSRNPRFNPQSEQASESVLVSRNADETEKRLGGAGELPITLTPSKEDFLSVEMLRLYESLLPTRESHEKRETFANKIEKILNEEWPGKDIKVHMFGSSMNDLGTTQSDVDLCVTTQWDGLKDIYLLSNCLRKRNMVIEQIVSKAKVPIVRLSDPHLNLACDINVNNTLALHNTRLIRKYVRIDPRVRPLAMMVKYWARRRVLNDAAKGGTISTYTWTCIILNFLQMRDPPILPVLHKIPHEDVEPIMVNGEDASFYENVDALEGFGSSNKESVGGLLFAFFRRMAFEFDYDKHVISLKQGKYLTKAEKGWDTCKGWKMLCIEEPFNTARNLGNSADDVSVNGLKEEFRRAYDILYESASLNALCEEYRFPQYNHYHHHYHYHYYYQNQTRYYNKHPSKQRPFNKTGGTWKSSNRKPVCTTKFHQNGQQNNCLNVTTDNFHDMDGKNNYSQDNEENGSSMLRFHDNYSMRQNGNYSTINSSEGFVASPVSEPIKRTNGYYENTDISELSSCSARKQFDNIQNRRERNGLSPATKHAEVDNFQHNILKEEPYSPQISHIKNNNSNNNYFNRQPHIKKRMDDQFNNNYNRTSQSQDTDSSTYKSNQEEFARHAGTTSNQNQSFYKNGGQKASASRFQHSSDQKLSCSYDSGIRYNNSDQKSFYDSDKRNYNKNHKQYFNKQDFNSRQVEDSNSSSIVPSVVDYPSSHSSFDHSNPAQIPNPKSGYKSNNNTKYRNYNKQRQFQKPAENVDFTNNNYSCNKVSDNSISSYPSNNNGFSLTYPNHGNGYLPSQAFTSSQQQNHHGQPNGGSSNYQRRMSHQSSSDGSNSQTSGNTSNTSYSNSSYTKSNYQKNNINQNNYQQQQSQNKSNNNGFNNGNKKRKYNSFNNYANNNNYNNSGNGNSRSNSTISNSSTIVSNGNNYNNSGNGNSRSNSTTSNSSTIAPNDNDSVLNYHEETIIHNTSSQMNQGHYYSGNNDTNGYKVYGNNGGYNKGYDNNNSNSWKSSSGSSKTLNGNNSNANANGPKSSNGCNNFSNRGVNGSNSNNHPRYNANYNNNNYSKNQNNNNNANKSVDNNNYSKNQNNNNNANKSVDNNNNYSKNQNNNNNANKSVDNNNNYSKNQNNNNNANKSVDNNNSNMQTKNVNNNYSNSRNNSNGSTNYQRNNQTKKGINRNNGKNNRKNSNAVKTEKKEDGVNHQQQYLQETSLQERQNHQNTQSHQQKKFFQNGQSNNNSKGKGGQRNSYFKQNAER